MGFLIATPCKKSLRLAKNGSFLHQEQPANGYINEADSARTGKIRPDTSGFIRRATAKKQGRGRRETQRGRRKGSTRTTAKRSNSPKTDHADSARTGKIRPDTSGFIRRATAEKQGS